MMDPTIGRWLTEDPEGFTAEDMNLYRYVENNPTNLVDPNGLDPNDDDTYQFGQGNWELSDTWTHRLKENKSAVLKKEMVPDALKDGRITILPNVHGSLQGFGRYPAPGILICYFGDAAKDVSFIQFHQFQASYLDAKGKEVREYGGKAAITTPHGAHKVSSKFRGSFWYLDVPEGAKSAAYGQTETQGGFDTHPGTVYSPSANWQWMYDPPASPLLALQAVYNESVDEYKENPTGLLVKMVASTYLVYKGEPFYRIDWESSIRWMNDGKKLDAGALSKDLTIKILDHTTNWNNGKVTRDQYSVLTKDFPDEKKRIWTVAPK